jgi:CRISPR-associated protein Csb2
LQILGSGVPVADGAAATPATLAVLIPTDADPGDVGVAYRALAALTSVRGPGGRTIGIDVSAMQVLPGHAFWRPPAPGQTRLWRTEPPAVPDTRGSRDESWTFAHAALLSVGFAWKDFLPHGEGRGRQQHRAVVDIVSARGVAVVHVSAVRSLHVNRYVHKVNEHAVVRPYRATLTMGDLAGPTTIQAIGQSRHLGGGLLVPLDVPEGSTTEQVRMLWDGGLS